MLSRIRRANLVHAEVLYSAHQGTTQHSVYQHYSEQRILCIGDQQLNLRFCNDLSFRRLRATGFQHIHLGLIMIRILHRRGAGTNALLVLRDNPMARRSTNYWNHGSRFIYRNSVDLYGPRYDN